MKQLVTLLTIFTISHSCLARGKEDPKSYFMPKSWSIELTRPNYLYAKSTYLKKPTHKPNELEVELRCGHKKTVPIFKGLKYCGIDFVKMVDGKLEITFVDFQKKGARGYCTKQRKKLFSIPSCPEKPKPTK